MANPLYSHWIVVKRILRYLRRTISFCLHVHPANASMPFSLRVMCDVDRVSNVDDKKSISNSTIFRGPNLISWWSRKQHVIARSSIEVEYWG